MCVCARARACVCNEYTVRSLCLRVRVLAGACMRASV